MQPYFYPYIGYFELIKSVDLFVLMDDVQYIRRGWVNRNRLPSHHKDFLYLTVPVLKCPRNTLIKDVRIDHSLRWHQCHLDTLRHTYGERIIDHAIYHFYSSIDEEILLYHLLEKTLRNTCEFLEIDTPFARSSDIITDGHGVSKIINICCYLGASTYVNAPGGVDLYSEEYFQSNGLDLEFMKPTVCENKFSILDVCFNE